MKHLNCVSPRLLKDDKVKKERKKERKKGKNEEQRNRWEKVTNRNVVGAIQLF